MARCACCSREGARISRGLGACGECLARGEVVALTAAREAHRRSRGRFGLPPVPPRKGLVTCPLCANVCRMPEGERGFCGLRACRDQRLVHLAGTPAGAVVEWYHDGLPTNCVGSWVCPAGTGEGYPEFAVSAGPELGYKNLAVFYAACTFDCAFCQNWHFREVDPERAHRTNAAELARAADRRTSCICYFGGDPSAQMAHALETSRIARERSPCRVLRICWETNGSMRRRDLLAALALSLGSGGCVKFDLKCWTESLHRALTGRSNRMTLSNFKVAARCAERRPEIPLVIASTLLVPGYVGAQEVGKLARFVAELSPSIPYSLLAFHGDFEMRDLPVTTRRDAEEAAQAALDAGLERVHLGNIHLLR